MTLLLVDANDPVCPKLDGLNLVGSQINVAKFFSSL